MFSESECSCRLPFVGLQQHVYEEVMSRRGDRRKNHGAFDAWQDMKCVSIPGSTCLSIKALESWIPDHSDMEYHLWCLVEPVLDNFCNFWVDMRTAFGSALLQKLPGKWFKKVTGINLPRIRLSRCVLDEECVSSPTYLPVCIIRSTKI